MDIQVKVNVLANSENRVKAIAGVTFDNVFAVTGIKVVEGQNGIFIAMPQRKTASGEYKDICFPVTADFRKVISGEIIDAYNKEVAQNNTQEQQFNIPETQNNYSNYDFGNSDLPFLKKLSLVTIGVTGFFIYFKKIAKNCNKSIDKLKL